MDHEKYYILNNCEYRDRVICRKVRLIRSPVNTAYVSQVIDNRRLVTFCLTLALLGFFAS